MSKYNDETLSYYGITKTARLNLENPATSSYGAWSGSASRALDSVYADVSKLDENLSVGAKEYKEETPCAKDFAAAHKNTEIAKKALAEAKKHFRNAMRCMS